MKSPYLRSYLTCEEVIGIRKAFTFDVDGVIVDASRRYRLAKELAHNKQEFWRMFFSEELLELDKPRATGVELIKERSKKGLILLVTGRPQKLLKVTLKQVMDFTGVRPKYIYMRRSGDMRSSPTVKLELIDRALSDGFSIVEYHDDEVDVLRNLMKLHPEITLYLHYNNSYKLFSAGNPYDYD